MKNPRWAERLLAVIADIVVYDGTDELDVFGPVEVLRSAAEFGGDVAARIVTRTTQDSVMSAHGVRFSPDGVLGDQPCDVLIVTGGSWLARASVGAWGEVQRGELLTAVAAASARARITASVCTGTMLLAHAGLVGTRRATTHHTAWEELSATGAHVVPERVVDDGDLVTAGGVTSGIDLALWLVQREFGEALAEQVAQRMEYERFVPGS